MKRMHHRGFERAGLAALLAVTSSGLGCSGGETSTSGSMSTSTSGSAGGAGGAGESSSGSVTPTTTSTSGGGGQGGGATAACIDPSEVANLFTLEAKGFCATAIYKVDGELGGATWGSHGGPLTIANGTTKGAIDVVRWSPPTGAMGKLTRTTTHLDAVYPAAAFLGGQALDLPFFGWTAVAWTGAFPNTQGEIVLLKGASVEARYAVNGAFALAAIPGGDAAHGRLLYTGLSALANANASKNGLYAADACGTAAKPALSSGSDPSCKPPVAVAAWGESSGPIAADRDGNVIAVMPSYASGMQEGRGFAAAQIATGAGPSEGATLFTVGGFGSSLAAIAPAASKSGVAVYQPFDAKTYAPGDVIAAPYSVRFGAIKAEGAPTAFLKIAKGVVVSLMRDGEDRIWASAQNGNGSTAVVIQRSP